MPKLTVDVPHSLGQEEAVQRLKAQFSSLKDSFQEHISSLEEDWNGNAMDFRLATQGVTVTGKVAIDPTKVTVDAQLPLIAMIFKGKIESQIRERLGQMLV